MHVWHKWRPRQPLDRTLHDALCYLLCLYLYGCPGTI